MMKPITVYFALAFLASALSAAAQTTPTSGTPVPQRSLSPAEIKKILRGVHGGGGPPPLTPKQKALEDAKLAKINDLMQAGTEALHLKNFAAAGADYRELVQAEPCFYNYYGLGEALAGQGKTTEALAVYKTAVYWPLNSPEGQIALSQRGINTPNLRGCSFPTDAVAWLKYALLLSQTGQNEEAFFVYSQAIPWVHDTARSNITLFPSTSLPSPSKFQASAHIALGLLEGGMLGDPKQAISEFDQALQLELTSSVTNYYSGYGLKRLGRQAEAQAAFKKAASLDQDGEVKAAAEKELTGR